MQRMPHMSNAQYLFQKMPTRCQPNSSYRVKVLSRHKSLHDFLTKGASLMMSTYTGQSAKQQKHGSWFMLLVSFIFALNLTGCGGGSGSGDSQTNNSDDGQVLVALTDAAGDFVTYTVDVLSIKLTHANGSVVETLPITTRVDFAQYTELTEFLTAATVPNGRYVKGSIVLDYSNADIQVEDDAGNAKPVTDIVDSNGTAVTTLDVKVTLEGRSALPVAPGIPKNLMLDFDLKQSNTVVFDGDQVKVTVEPILIAEVDPQTPKRQRVRGPLKTVNVAASAFDIYIRPFFHRISLGQRVFGTLRVQANDETYYEINGIGYKGAQGLQVLETVAQYTGVIVKGDLKFAPLRYEAREVYAGSSVPGGDLDLVRGTVTSRNGNQIIVRGATVFRANGTVVFNDSVTVSLDNSTTVLKQLSLGTFNISDISVGQRIAIFGTVTNDQVSDLQMSAANGYARMALSYLSGNVVAMPDESTDFTLNLSSINGRTINLYDFSGTGTSGNDANPVSYEVDTGTLTLDGIAVEQDVRTAGFPTPFGTAPSDYTAQTVGKK